MVDLQAEISDYEPPPQFKEQHLKLFNGVSLLGVKSCEIWTAIQERDAEGLRSAMRRFDLGQQDWEEVLSQITASISNDNPDK